MDQIKIGAFLKELRKAKKLTQEQLAEQLNVSNRTVSRWETGSNMPDIGLLVEIADFYDVSIPELIRGERNGEPMDKEIRQTAAAMAEYGRSKVTAGKRQVAGGLLTAFGLFIILTALLIFPAESSWSGNYSILGSIVLLAGIALLLPPAATGPGRRTAVVLGCAVLLFGTFMLSDYLAVSRFHQVPRFRYETRYDSRFPDQIVYKTIFFTAVHQNPGTAEEQIFILR